MGGIDSLLLILSADHIIDNISNFHKALNTSFKYALKDNLITFGIVPNYPETGYGYIESEDNINDGKKEVSKIKKFIEKPKKEVAEKLIKSNRFTWNSGMFIFKTSLILEELEKHSPTIIKLCKDAINNSIKDLDFIRIDPLKFSKCPTFLLM